MNPKLFQTFKNDLSHESISLSFLFFLKSTKMVSYTLHALSPQRTKRPGPQAYSLPLAEVTGADSWQDSTPQAEAIGGRAVRRLRRAALPFTPPRLLRPDS